MLKMKYSSGKDYLKNRIRGISNEFVATDYDEMDYAKFANHIV